MVEAQSEKAGCADGDKLVIAELQARIKRILAQRDEANELKISLQSQLNTATECIEDLRSEIKRLTEEGICRIY